MQNLCEISGTGRGEAGPNEELEDDQSIIIDDGAKDMYSDQKTQQGDMMR